jgi:hypothetical protein
MIRNVSLVNGQTDRLALPYWLTKFGFGFGYCEVDCFSLKGEATQ